METGFLFVGSIAFGAVLWIVGWRLGHHTQNPLRPRLRWVELAVTAVGIAVFFFGVFGLFVYSTCEAPCDAYWSP